MRYRELLEGLVEDVEINDVGESINEDLYQSFGDPVGYRAVGYWFNAKTGVAHKITWGNDEGHADGDHHVDFLMKKDRRNEFFGPDQQAWLDDNFGGGIDMETCFALTLESNLGWCRVSILQMSEKTPARINIDAANERDAAVTLRWMMKHYPIIGMAYIQIWKDRNGWREKGHELKGEALERFLKYGRL